MRAFIPAEVLWGLVNRRPAFAVQTMSHVCLRWIMKQLVQVCLLFFASTLVGQGAIPNGTILPMELSSSLNSGKARAGQVISARIRQDVPLPGGVKIRAGSKVLGHVVEASRPDSAKGATLALRFDAIVMSQRRTKVSTSLRAIASPMAVWDAQLPKTGPDRGTPEDAWTTVQVGDDEVVYRGGGPVARGLQVVGQPTANGVLVRVGSKPGSKCRTEDDGPQALWVFSSDACGIYGFEGLRIDHWGHTNPNGQIVLASTDGNVRLQSGSGILLRVDRTIQEHVN
jgi:hypothetical protein